MMLKGLGDMGQIFKMQKELKNIQKKIKSTKIEGSSRDGSVKAVINGDYKLLELAIDEDFFKNNDRKAVEKSVSDAVNTALERCKDFASQEMSKLTGGLNIPGLSNFMK